eukprot:360207-Chlamydomonas_euryale.AAC.17
MLVAGAGCCLLVAGRCMLYAGCWLLVAGCWISCVLPPSQPAVTRHMPRLAAVAGRGTCS